MNDRGDSESLPDPPATEVVNAAISLFAVAYPLQTPKVQELLLEQLATFLASASLQRDPGRKVAVTVNAAMALLGILKVAVGETTADKGDIKSQLVEKIIEEILRVRLFLSYGVFTAHSLQVFSSQPRSHYPKDCV